MRTCERLGVQRQTLRFVMPNNISHRKSSQSTEWGISREAQNLENGEGHVEVMVLENWGRVESG